jgi:hypothetical protein
MSPQPRKDFGKRQLEPTHDPVRKRSNHVALLLMGTMALGGGAYALMPSEHCDPNRPGISASSTGQPSDCQQRSSSSSSGGHSYSGGGSGSSPRSNFASIDSSSSSSGSHGSSSSTIGVTRGGFGSFMSHFSGGG